jgi:hypothetical protein
VRILPRDVEQGLKEFASGVEQLVDKLVRRPLGPPQRLQPALGLRERASS